MNASQLERNSKMDLLDIRKLVAEYKVALSAELSAKADLASEQEGLEEYRAGLLAMAYADGTIDGKNADTRKRQETQVIADDQDTNELEFQIAECAEIARNAEVERKASEAFIGLVKAWLYSQAKIG